MDMNAAGKYPFGSVPVLEVDGVTYAQSVGILRYVGRLGGESVRALGQSVRMVNPRKRPATTATD